METHDLPKAQVPTLESLEMASRRRPRPCFYKIAGSSTQRHLGPGARTFSRVSRRSPFCVAMDLSALYESLLSLSPDLPSNQGDTESSPGWASGLWSLSSSESSPAGVAARLPGRSTSLVEGRSCGWVPPPPGFAPLAPRPGTELSPSPTSTPTTSSRYKTELCRTFSESGRCRYGAKCQFAHGLGELRQASRHPKYKTELCHKFYLQGRCPYGSRCHFIHNPSEDLASPGHPHMLRQSISFSGLPSGRRSSPPPAGLAGPSLSSCSFSPSSSPPPPGDLPLSPSAFSAAPGTPVALRDPTPACCPSCRRATPSSVWGPVGGLARSPSAHSLGSDPDDYASSGSSLGGSDSPVFEAGVFGPPQPVAPRRLPIFNRISVSE
ncbi:Tristetraprolin [Myotis brandtii]|uniref:mRNA decay activator protein ZFP36 n=2 Tax=Myotis brandtii TaxID=109478 RepID=S7N097_MYOBR|nr:Tristetraprolin [Myotis brandtii]